MYFGKHILNVVMLSVVEQSNNFSFISNGRIAEFDYRITFLILMLYTDSPVIKNCKSDMSSPTYHFTEILRSVNELPLINVSRAKVDLT